MSAVPLKLSRRYDRISFLTCLSLFALTLLLVYGVTSNKDATFSSPSKLVKRMLLTEAEEEEGPESAALIDYLGLYNSASARQKPFLFAGFILWLIFLFAFVGITASDFFCPNLSTIATRLGMSESVAGVTFLAFSNGSPDVFSTFASLKQGSGSLAIGELLGAASFIVSVVAGTMCVIQPFTVERHTFLRDVGFFTVAVTFTLAILWDSHIHEWEAAAMVGLYALYVTIVAIGSWWESRRAKKERRIKSARNEYAPEDETTPVRNSRRYRDDASHLVSPSPKRHPTPATTGGTLTTLNNSQSFPFPSLNSPSLSHHRHHHFELDHPTPSPSIPSSPPHLPLASPGASTSRPLSPLPTPTAGRSRSHSHVHRRTQSTGPTPGGAGNVRTSLLGAIEFRDVVNSLKADSNARSLGLFGPIALRDDDLPGAGTRVIGRPRTMSLEGGRRKNSATAGAGGTTVPSGSTTAAGDLSNPRRVTWTGAGEPRWDESGAGETHEEEDEEDDESGGSSTIKGISSPSGAESPLIDLSAGVDDPWKGAVVRPSTLRVDIPTPPWPDSALRRTTSAASSLRSQSAAMARQSSAQSQHQPPSIQVTSVNGSSFLLNQTPTSWFGSLTIVQKFKRMSRSRLWNSIKRVTWALFPSLQEWKSKSWVGRITALLCVPAILALNLTLPVVENEEEAGDGDESCSDDDCSEGGEGGYRDGQGGEETEDEDDLIDLSEGATESRRKREAVSHQFHQQVLPKHLHPFNYQYDADQASIEPACDRPSPWADEVDEDGHVVSVDEQLRRYEREVREREIGKELEEIRGERKEEDRLTRSLTAVQCALGPVFCVSALFADDLRWWQPLAAFGVGLCIAVFAYWCFEDRRHPGRIVLCFVGFFVAMVWILMIVNEVVGVLQTFGHIFGLSDAILGLTIFAMGNSLGDLVANATVARMGFSQMAIAACFASPLLNMLLGIGLSGSYIIISQGGGPLHVEMGKTLFVSGVGLLVVLISTLIIVPMNGYWMSTKLGWGLIAAYVCVLSLNICVEIWSES